MMLHIKQKRLYIDYMVLDNICSCIPSEYDLEMPQSYFADQPTAYVKHVNPEAGQFVAPWA